MSQHPRIPPFAGHVPQIGQNEKRQQQQVQVAIVQLSQAFYAQLVVGYIARLDEHQDADLDRMRQLARDAVAAAKCYFEAARAMEAEKEVGGS